MRDDRIEVDTCGLSADQYAIVECIGIENYRKLSERFGGGHIYIQKPQSLNRQKRNEMIISEYNNGLGYREIAIKYRLSEVWVRNIIAGKV